MSLRELAIARGWIRPGARPDLTVPTPATWIEAPTLHIDAAGREAAAVRMARGLMDPCIDVDPVRAVVFGDTREATS